jgi:hypothetical protein
VKPLTKDDLLPYAEYERIRARLRPLFIEEKQRRRLSVGDHLTLLFENDRSVWYQVEEMLRAEKISAEEAVQHEIDTYNELLPSNGELSATLLIEYADLRERDALLRQLVGLDEHLWIVLGEHRRKARFNTSQMSPERISAVQFVRFPLGQFGATELARLADEGRVAIEVDHPRLTEKAPLPGALARALAQDLTADT